MWTAASHCRTVCVRSNTRWRDEVPAALVTEQNAAGEKNGVDNKIWYVIHLTAVPLKLLQRTSFDPQGSCRVMTLNFFFYWISDEQHRFGCALSLVCSVVFLKWSTDNDAFNGDVFVFLCTFIFIQSKFNRKGIWGAKTVGLTLSVPG